MAGLILNEKQVAAFFSKTKRVGDCLVWTACKNSDGYGQFMAHPKLWSSHRLAWTLTHGSIPSGMHVLHKCDNPSCIEPKHLFLGSHADNMRDAWVKGRKTMSESFLRYANSAKPGEKNGRAKLTRQQVEEIRRCGGRQKEVAAKFGVSKSAVSMIRTNQTWRA